MTSAVRTTATVQPGGLIEVHSSDLPEGATVEVIVLIDSPKPDSRQPKQFSQFLGATKGSFSSVAEVDDYIFNQR